MASIPKTDSSLPPVFDHFAKLNYAVYMRDFPEPSTNGTASTTATDTAIGQPAATSSSRPDPVTIVIFFWMGAAYKHAAKYLSEYLKIAPQARIFAIFTSPTDFFARARVSDAEHGRRVEPVVQALLASFPPREDSGDEEEPRGSVYVHAFSNGGSITFKHVASAYLEKAGKPLPAKAVIFDSAPSSVGIRKAVKAMSYSFPANFILRMLVSGAIWAVLLLSWVYDQVTRREHPYNLAILALNDTRVVDKKGKRCYIYSAEDDLVDWENVEKHATAASKAGWVVEREKFHGSPHVGHMRLDPQRYWSIVARYMKLVIL